MKTRTFAVLILLIPVFGFSQINSSIDFIAGADYSYRHLNTSSEDAIIVGIMDSRNERETAKLNWRVGFNYNKRLTSKLFVKAGLRWASLGYSKQKRTGLTWGSEFDGMGGYTPDPNLPHEIQLIHDYWFIELPIAGRFEFSAKKFTPFVEAGIAPSLYLTTRTRQKTDIGNSVEYNNGEAHNFNTLHLVSIISFGANYALNNNFQLFGQPTFRYHFTKLADAPIGEYLFNIGIELGIRRTLNNNVTNKADTNAN